MKECTTKLRNLESNVVGNFVQTQLGKALALRNRIEQAPAAVFAPADKSIAAVRTIESDILARLKTLRTELQKLV